MCNVRDTSTKYSDVCYLTGTLGHSNCCEDNLPEPKREMLSEHLQRGKRKSRSKHFSERNTKIPIFWPDLLGMHNLQWVFLITENKVLDEPKTDSVFSWQKRSSKELPQHRLHQEAPKILAAALSTWAKPCWLMVKQEANFVTQSKLLYFSPFTFLWELGEKLGQLY